MKFALQSSMETSPLLSVHPGLSIPLQRHHLPMGISIAPRISFETFAGCSFISLHLFLSLSLSRSVLVFCDNLRQRTVSRRQQ